MSAEDEIKAMGGVAKSLDTLESDAIARVLIWAASHYGVVLTAPKIAKGIGAAAAISEPGGNVSYGSFAELFNAAGPKTEKDKALVAAYFAQVCENNENFQSQSLNDALKHLGHPIGNITEALTQLRNERPALILQLKKSGTSRQARKTYKLTLEGVKRVETMVHGEASE